MEDKLREVYRAMDNNRRILEDSLAVGVLGPCTQNTDTARYGFSDERIAAAREGDMTGLVDGHGLRRVGGTSEWSTQSDDQTSHRVMADMMLLAQAGVIDCENYSESIGLCRYRTSKGFQELLPKDPVERFSMYGLLAYSTERDEQLRTVDDFIQRNYQG